MVGITYLSGYTKRKAITIDYTKVSASLSNFPVLVSISADTDIGGTALSTGYDIRFTSDDGATLLDYERESFSISNGSCTALFWVRIPSLSNTVDTIIYLYYNGDSEATDGENKTGVWDSNFKGVWHLGESGTGTAGDYKDSTVNTNNSTNTTGQPTATTGQIANGQQFDNTDDYIGCGTGSSLNITGAVTLEAWVNLTHKSTVQYILSKRSWDITITTTDTVTFRTKLADDSAYDTDAISSALTTGSWTHIVCVYDPATNSKVIYKNGVAGTSVSKTDGATPDNATRVFAIGKYSISTVYSPSAIDEARVSNIARSGDWILTEYNNHSSPSTFFSLGTEETDTPTSTINPAIIEFNEDNEMKQFVGTSRKHPVRAYNDSTGAPVTELTTPTFYVSVNGENRQELSLTISAFDANHQWFWLTIPGTIGTITPVDGDEVSITFGDTVASGFAMVHFVDDTYSKAELDAAFAGITVDTTGLALTTDITTSQAAIQADIAAIETTGGSGGGMGHIITDYTFDPTANTITITEVGYTDVKQEEVISIFNLTTGTWLYNPEFRKYGAIPAPWTTFYKLESVTGGVITYTAPDAGAASGDKLQIVVNIT